MGLRGGVGMQHALGLYAQHHDHLTIPFRRFTDQS